MNLKDSKSTISSVCWIIINQIKLSLMKWINTFLKSTIFLFTITNQPTLNIICPKWWPTMFFNMAHISTPILILCQSQCNLHMDIPNIILLNNKDRMNQKVQARPTSGRRSPKANSLRTNRTSEERLWNIGIDYNTSLIWWLLILSKYNQYSQTDYYEHPIEEGMALVVFDEVGWLLGRFDCEFFDF